MSTLLEDLKRTVFSPVPCFVLRGLAQIKKRLFIGVFRVLRGSFPSTGKIVRVKCVVLGRLYRQGILC